MDFSVSKLPQQKIADSMFTTRANQEIGIDFTSGEQFASKGVLVDLGGIKLPKCCAFSQPSGCNDQLVPASVVGADVEMNSIVGRRTLRRFLDQGLKTGRQGIKIAKKTNPHPLRL